MPTWGALIPELRAAQAQAQAGALPNGETPFDFVRRNYLESLSRRTDRNVILYATRWTSPGAIPDPSLVSITPEDIQGFMEVVYQLPPRGLDLIVHSPGGSAEAAEAIVRYLRTRFSDVRVIVPHAAMSAATMLACSANRVLMGKHSSLGPIDPQMFVALDGGGRQLIAAHAILEQFNFIQAKLKADPSLLPALLPLMKHYGPALIVQCQIAQQLSKQLVENWLAEFMFASQGSAQAKTTAHDIAETLGDHARFLSHSRFIDRARAKSLGLVVEDLEADQGVQDDVLSAFHATMHTFNGSSQCFKIIENHLRRAWIKGVATPTVQFVIPPQGFPFPGGLPFPIPVAPQVPGAQPPVLPGASP